MICAYSISWSDIGRARLEASAAGPVFDWVVVAEVARRKSPSQVTYGSTNGRSARRPLGPASRWPSACRRGEDLDGIAGQRARGGTSGRGHQEDRDGLHASVRSVLSWCVTQAADRGQPPLLETQSRSECPEARNGEGLAAPVGELGPTTPCTFGSAATFHSSS